MHDRQFGRAGVAEEVGDAFALQERQKRRSSRNPVHKTSSNDAARAPDGAGLENRS
jgi:hypothetical protein